MGRENAFCQIVELYKFFTMRRGQLSGIPKVIKGLFMRRPCLHFMRLSFAVKGMCGQSAFGFDARNNRGHLVLGQT